MEVLGRFRFRALGFPHFFSFRANSAALSRNSVDRKSGLKHVWKIGISTVKVYLEREFLIENYGAMKVF